jgi:hypothetical protein
MALKALVNGKMVHADDLSEDQFRAIQVKKPQVIMFCCQTRATCASVRSIMSLFTTGEPSNALVALIPPCMIS